MWYNVRRKILQMLLNIFRREMDKVSMREFTQEQRDTMLSGIYQNEAYRKYVIMRDRQIVIEMTKFKPSDERYQELFGASVELMNFHNMAKLASERRQRALEEGKRKARELSSSAGLKQGPHPS